MCVWPALISDTDADTHGLSKNDFSIAISSQSKLDRVVATMAAAAAADAGSMGMGMGLPKSIVFCHYRREMLQLRDMLLRSSVGENDIAIIDGTVGARDRASIFAAAPTVLILQFALVVRD